MEEQTNLSTVKWMFESGGLAFPADVTLPEGGVINMPGMTLRDWFAGQVEMPRDGISQTWAEALMGEKTPDWQLDNALDCIRWWSTAEARARYITADAMLAERSKRGASS